MSLYLATLLRMPSWQTTIVNGVYDDRGRIRKGRRCILCQERSRTRWKGIFGMHTYFDDMMHANAKEEELTVSPSSSHCLWERTFLYLGLLQESLRDKWHGFFLPGFLSWFGVSLFSALQSWGLRATLEVLHSLSLLRRSPLAQISLWPISWAISAIEADTTRVARYMWPKTYICAQRTIWPLLIWYVKLFVALIILVL